MVKKNRNEYAVAIWFVVGLFAIFLVTFLIFRGMGTIEYEGLTFTKERVGSIPVYHYYYLYKEPTGQLVQNNIYLRNNPEKNDIPVEGSKIIYVKDKFVYISINASALENCSQSSIAISQLASFIANGGLTVRGASLENVTSTNSSSNSTRYGSCKMYPRNPVIEINRGNESKVLVNALCYQVQFAKCDDVLPAVEKLIVQSILDAKELG